MSHFHFLPHNYFSFNKSVINSCFSYNFFLLLFQPMTKLVTDLEQVNVTVKVTKGTSERDYKDHLQEVKVSI